jgi:hypothetical protein
VISGMMVVLIPVVEAIITSHSHLGLLSSIKQREPINSEQVTVIMLNFRC